MVAKSPFGHCHCLEEFHIPVRVLERNLLLAIVLMKELLEICKLERARLRERHGSLEFKRLLSIWGKVLSIDRC